MTRSAPGGRDQVRDELRRDRHARLVLPVLPLKAEVRMTAVTRPAEARRAASIITSSSIKFVAGGRSAGHEDVGTADVLVDFTEGLGTSRRLLIRVRLGPAPWRRVSQIRATGVGEEPREDQRDIRVRHLRVPADLPAGHELDGAARDDRRRRRGLGKAA